MLQKEEVVKIGNNFYRVTPLNHTELPCVKCALKDCHKNRDFDALKAQHRALSCVDLIPINSRFEYVDVE